MCLLVLVRDVDATSSRRQGGEDRVSDTIDTILTLWYVGILSTKVLESSVQPPSLSVVSSSLKRVGTGVKVVLAFNFNL